MEEEQTVAVNRNPIVVSYQKEKVDFRKCFLEKENNGVVISFVFFIFQFLFVFCLFKIVFVIVVCLSPFIRAYFFSQKFFE